MYYEQTDLSEVKLDKMLGAKKTAGVQTRITAVDLLLV